MRPYCPRCHYPKKTCICEHIRTTKTTLDVVIIQHPKEALHAKNTAKLVALSIPSATIINAEDTHAMRALSHQCSTQQTLLVYPSDTSLPIELITEKEKQSLSTIILIDGSWKQAFGIVKQHPWLASLNAVHFTHAPASDYVIRHTSLSHALSTLEAAAYSIATIEDSDVTPLHELQRAMQAHWQGPSSHLRKT